MPGFRLKILSVICLFISVENATWAKSSLDVPKPMATKGQQANLANTSLENSGQLPFKISRKASRIVQTLTGITPLTELVVGQIARMAIEKKVCGKVRVRVKTWSFTDCLAGKFKSVDVRIKKCVWQDLSLGDCRFSSITPIWLNYLNNKKERSGLRSPILLSLVGRVRQEDLAAILKNEKGCFSALKLDLPGLGEQQLAVLSPTVSITEEKVIIRGVLVTKGANIDTGVPLTIAGGIKLDGDDRIVLENMAVQSNDIIEPQKFAAFIESLLNPLLNLKRFDRHNLAVRLNTLQVSNGFVEANGKLLLAPTKPLNAGPQIANQ